MTRPRLQVVVGIIQNSVGEILMVRNNKAPSDKLWSLPGGKVDRHENIHDGLVREVWEETGLKVAGYLCHKEEGQRTFYQSLYDIHYFYCEVLGGKLDARPNTEILERRWFARHELKSIPLRYNDSWERALNKYYAIKPDIWTGDAKDLMPLY